MRPKGKHKDIGREREEIHAEGEQTEKKEREIKKDGWKTIKEYILIDQRHRETLRL